MDEHQQNIISLVTQNKCQEAAEQILAQKDKSLDSFFLPIFDGINGLQRIQLFKSLLLSHTLTPPDDDGILLKFFTCIRPSEHGVILEDMENSQIEIMLKRMEESKKIELYELLPYNVVEKLVPIMTASEKHKLGLDDPNSSKSKKCNIQ